MLLAQWSGYLTNTCTAPSLVKATKSAVMLLPHWSDYYSQHSCFFLIGQVTEEVSQHSCGFLIGQVTEEVSQHSCFFLIGQVTEEVSQHSCGFLSGQGFEIHSHASSSLGRLLSQRSFFFLKGTQA
jgi:hypothetical protein